MGVPQGSVIAPTVFNIVVSDVVPETMDKMALTTTTTVTAWYDVGFLERGFV